MESKPIEIKSYFSDWHEVSKATALRYAAQLYGGMMCRDRVAEVHLYIRGISFTEKELRDEWNHIAAEKMCEGA